MNLLQTQKNSSDIAKEYISEVLEGKITVCKWVKLFCERHVKDLENCKKRNLYFDERAGSDEYYAVVLKENGKPIWKDTYIYAIVR